MIYLIVIKNVIYIIILMKLDETDNFHCSEKCPQNYKLIEEDKKCIDDCKYDSNYKYEYKSVCFRECPESTLFNEISNVCEEIKKTEDV